MNDKKHLELAYAPGGYYSFTLPGKPNEYNLLRLITINSMSNGALHATTYNKTFSEVPSVDEVLALRPFVQHAPFDLAGVFDWQNTQLIHHKPFTHEDLAGYEEYLRIAHDMDDSEIAERIERVILLSQQPPAKLVIDYDSNGKVSLDVRTENTSQ